MLMTTQPQLPSGTAGDKGVSQPQGGGAWVCGSVSHPVISFGH